MLDFNVLERNAQARFDAGNFGDALKIYLYMAGADPSLEAGYFAMRIGECYERMDDLHAAKYWYGRAVEENPTISRYVAARRRLEHVNIDELIRPEDRH